LKLALFDFDGTITRKDSFIDFIRYFFGIRFIMGIFILSPVIVLHLLRIMPNWKAKEIVFSYFFKGIDYAFFTKKASLYSEHELTKILKSSALEEISRHKEQNVRIAIVTAAFEPYLQDWCDKNGFDLIGTRLQVENGKLTGKFKGKNCYGDEKVRRIEQKYNLAEIDYIYAYGDTRGDREMLSLGNESFYRNF